MEPESSMTSRIQAKTAPVEEKQIVETTVRARQGYLGRRALLILSASLILALLTGFLVLGAG